MNFTIATKRVVILCACLVVSAVALARASKTEPTPLRVPLSQLPFRFGEFEGTRSPDLEPNVLRVLGVDDYINRVYRQASASLPIGLYIGYYMSQREGDTMHSPMNCLPGSGWQPVQSGRLVIPINGVPQEVNRYLVEKNGEQLLVLYWYQSHGRIVASEYWGKIYTVVDAMRMNRTDAALVRIVVPIGHTATDGEKAAESQGIGFVRQILPLLDKHIPA